MQIAVEVIIVLLTLLFVLYPLIIRKEEPSQAADIEAEILKLRKKKTRDCPKCGSANPPDARFCSECAARLNKD
jgi:hypothetical protein